MNRNKQTAFKGGSYSLIISVLVLATLILVNIFAQALPTNLTKFDISSSKLYSVTSNTKVVVGALQDDVTIYWVVQAGEEDSVIENLLDKYKTLSDHINVVKKNPDVYPTFTDNYTKEDVKNNSLIVECGDRYRYISYDDIYVQEADMYSYSYTTSFDGEGAITSAINYVTNTDFPVLYLLEGHGEGSLPDSFKKQVTRENIEMQQLSLLNVDNVPDDAAAIMIYAPQSDITKEEKDMLVSYAAAGGKILVLSGPAVDEDLTNLDSILSTYGVTMQEGVVVEGDREHFAFQSPYILLPDMLSMDVTDSLITERYSPIMPVSSGLVIGDTTADVESIMNTSTDAYSKKDGYNLTTYEKEDGDIDGPFSTAVSIKTASDGRIIWFASSEFIEDMYNAYSSGANDDLCMNALSALIGDRETIAIRSKSLNYNYLTISADDAALLKTLMIGALPAIYLLTGIIMTFNTRRKQNDAA